jgi:hypothetical protein
MHISRSMEDKGLNSLTIWILEIIDSDLKLSKQCTAAANKVNKMLGIIKIK